MNIMFRFKTIFYFDLKILKIVIQNMIALAQLVTKFKSLFSQSFSLRFIYKNILLIHVVLRVLEHLRFHALLLSLQVPDLLIVRLFLVLLALLIFLNLLGCQSLRLVPKQDLY